MNKKEILELKRRLTKNGCTFTRMCGCYVDAEKNVILNLSETFLTLEEEEFYKYLEIAKKVLSGTVGNNLLELPFAKIHDYEGSKQQFFMGLKDSKLKGEALLERFYELVIENYSYSGNFLILVFHDAYDVITKTTDKEELDESEEVYEYILCAVCPVELTKAGLGYHQEENRIGVCSRDWVVGMPETGFVFPAFTDRSSDIHNLLYYTKNPKDTHLEFMETILGCESKRTATEEKETFKDIVKAAVGDDEEKGESVLINIQKNLNYMVEEQEALSAGESEPVMLTGEKIHSVIADSEISEEAVEKIERFYNKEFGNTPAAARNLIDMKAIEANAQKERTLELQKEVTVLKKQLEEEKTVPSEKIVLKVAENKVQEIKTQLIDGKKYIIIPIEDGEETTINGVNKEL